MREPERRRQPDQHATQEGHRDREHQYTSIDGDLIDARNVRWNEFQDREQGRSHQYARGSTQPGQHHVFHKKLKQEIPASGAERYPNADLFPTSRGPNQQ